jgi:uncharacterized UBP type Zn finger protein
MKIKIEGACVSCHRSDVQNHAKNMCYNCYMREWYRLNKHKKLSTPVTETANSTTESTS